MVIVRPKMRLFGEKFVNLRTIFGSMRARNTQMSRKHKKMKLINSIKILALSAVVSLLLTSCLGDKESESVVTGFYNNIVTAFSLSNNDDVAAGLSKYSFTIDNYGLSDAAIHAKFPNDDIIFNADSLPYGTIADSIKVTMSFSAPDSAYFTLYSLDGVLRQYCDVAKDSAIYFASYPDARLHISARGNHKVYHVKINVHKVEPYVNCQMVAGKDAAKPGEGKNSWLTGTAAWMWYTVSQFLLGVKPTFNGLMVDPCLPADIKEYTVKRKFRDGIFNITIKNESGAQKGIKKLIVDGQEVAGNIIPNAAGEHEVTVVM